MINVVNIHKHPYDLPEDVYIGRGSALGNPYTSIQNRKTKAKFVCKSRDESVAKFKEYLLLKIQQKDKKVCDALNRIYTLAKEGDVNLVCFCSPKKCHGDIIKEVVESKLPKKLQYFCDNERHLVCMPYSIENLHKMAEDLGIKRCWFHKKNRKSHYDIPKGRIEEIKNKCTTVTKREIVMIINSKYKQ